MGKVIKILARGEKGNVVVIIAILFSVLAGFAALATDVGVLYFEDTKLARTADAAVLAGAQELPDTGVAGQVATDYAARNGVPVSEINISFSEDCRKITVNCTKQVELFFAKVLGFQASTVNGRAAARLVGVAQTDGLLPVGIDEACLPLELGHQYLIKVGSPSTGWTGIIEYPGQSGANDYRLAALNGYDGTVRIGDREDKAPGNVTGPTIQGLQERIDSAPAELWNNYQPDSRRIVLVPIYRVLGSLPIDQVEIVGFVSVFIENVVGHGLENDVFVRYVSHTVSDEADDTITSPYLNTVRLVE
jgi:hypothetical protein